MDDYEVIPDPIELGDDREDADFEGAYDIMIQLARSVSGTQK